MSLGIYVHIPFCGSKCSYCSFTSRVDAQQNIELYLQRLLQEINLRLFQLPACMVDTIYFGGGTPSILIPNQIKIILNAIKNCGNISFSPQLEVSCEMNPCTITRQKAEEYVQMGINRASVGVQTTSNNLLKSISRRHTAQDFLQSVDMLRQAGFTNISADLMLGLPNQTIGNVMQDIDVVTPLVTHISCYALKVEEGTPLFLQGYSPDDDLTADMYEAVVQRLGALGFNRYEVSNFALAGHECRHNLRYWQLKDYIGFGVSAHSFINNQRLFNTQSIDEYIACLPPAEVENRTDRDLAVETIMLGLRTSSGIDLEAVQDMLGMSYLDYLNKYSAQINKLKYAGLIDIDRGKVLKLTGKGFYVMNSVILELTSNL